MSAPASDGPLVHGLSIRSAVALPELHAGEVATNVWIRLDGLAPLQLEAQEGDSSCHATADEVRLFWRDVGTFLVRRGDEVVVDPAPGADERLLRAFLLGPVLAVLLHQRGRLVLHASAVSVAGEVVAFLGGPGWGKSTTAAALHARGHGVVADDVVALQMLAQRGPVVIPGLPQLRLWPEVSRAIGEVPERLPRVHPGLDKREMRVASCLSREPLALRRVYVLEPGDALEVEPLARQGALVELLRHSYGARSLHRVRTGSHFQQCASVASSVPALRLRVRRSLAGLTDLAVLIEEDLARPLR